jgi:hypothetical protein
MTVEVCPTDVVAAAPERIWELLTDPSQYPRWADGVVVAGPSGRVQPGDRIVLATGPLRLFRARLDVVAMCASEELTLDIGLPFGLRNHEVIRITLAGEGACRVTFN